jgi:hypothetical protein
MKVYARYFVILVVAFVVSACDGVTPNKCQVVKSSDRSNPYDLDFAMMFPANCPVPLGSVGEYKRAGATVYDRGQQGDFFDARGEVYTSDGMFAPNALDPRLPARHVTRFQSVGGQGQAELLVHYQAATGGNPWHDSGRFRAFNTTDRSDDAHAEIRITYSDADLRVATVGPINPHRNTLTTWSAAISGGVAPFEYRWHRDGTLVSTASSYTGHVGTTDFLLSA